MATRRSNSGQQRQVDHITDDWRLVGSTEIIGIRFGPLSSIDEHENIKILKEQAWKHVVNKSSMGSEIIMQNYLGAIRSIQKEVESAYPENLSIIWSEELRMMLIKDGCFFLQLALMTLGCHNELGYSPGDLIFGRRNINRGNKEWIQNMFTVGNQIPLVVLKKLMAQKFFRDIVSNKRKWTLKPASLSDKAFYELLVLPTLQWEKNQEASHILHGLQTLLIGKKNQLSDEDEIGEDFVVEANEDGYRAALVDASATSMKRSGIYIKKVASGGITSIDFQNYGFWACLYLPTFLLDANTEKILHNVISYEKQRFMLHEQRKVSSYIKFMSGFVRTKKDAKLLADRNVIIFESPDMVEELPEILRRLVASSEDHMVLTHRLQTVRRRIRNHAGMWTQIQSAIPLATLVLTFIQTVLTLLTYLQGRSHLLSS